MMPKSKLFYTQQALSGSATNTFKGPELVYTPNFEDFTSYDNAGNDAVAVGDFVYYDKFNAQIEKADSMTANHLSIGVVTYVDGAGGKCTVQTSGFSRIPGVFNGVLAQKTLFLRNDSDTTSTLDTGIVANSANSSYGQPVAYTLVNANGTYLDVLLLTDQTANNNSVILQNVASTFCFSSVPTLSDTTIPLNRGLHFEQSGETLFATSTSSLAMQIGSTGAATSFSVLSQNLAEVLKVTDAGILTGRASDETLEVHSAILLRGQGAGNPGYTGVIQNYLGDSMIEVNAYDVVINAPGVQTDTRRSLDIDGDLKFRDEAASIKDSDGHKRLSWNTATGSTTLHRPDGAAVIEILDDGVLGIIRLTNTTSTIFEDHDGTDRLTITPTLTNLHDGNAVTRLSIGSAGVSTTGILAHTGSATISTTLNVTGELTAGTLDINNAAGVAAEIAGNLTVEGTTTTAGLNVNNSGSGAADISGNLEVTGTLEVGTVLTVNPDIVIDGTGYISTLSGDLILQADDHIKLRIDTPATEASARALVVEYQKVDGNTTTYPNVFEVWDSGNLVLGASDVAAPVLKIKGTGTAAIEAQHSPNLDLRSAGNIIARLDHWNNHAGNPFFGVMHQDDTYLMSVDSTGKCMVGTTGHTGQLIVRDGSQNTLFSVNTSGQVIIANSCTAASFWVGGNELDVPFTGAHIGVVVEEEAPHDTTVHVSEESEDEAAVETSLTVWYPKGTLVKLLESVETAEDVDGGENEESPFQIHYKVTKSDTPRDKSAFGVYGAPFEHPWHVQKAHYHTLLCLGDGHILVTGEGGDIEIGDYICSSSHPGHAMKQEEEYLANFTVAKATQSVVFDNKKKKPVSQLITCTYHSA